MVRTYLEILQLQKMCMLSCLVCKNEPAHNLYSQWFSTLSTPVQLSWNLHHLKKTWPVITDDESCRTVGTSYPSLELLLQYGWRKFCLGLKLASALTSTANDLRWCSPQSNIWGATSHLLIHFPAQGEDNTVLHQMNMILAGNFITNLDTNTKLSSSVLSYPLSLI